MKNGRMYTFVDYLRGGEQKYLALFADFCEYEKNAIIRPFC